jgi:2-polyprenyl-6-methoxyphenol hydroxylase-like FAD-dependent oxidoreductase
MAGVGIVGAGISGLTLALRLQQLGVEATVYAETTPDAMRAARLPNTVARFPHTLARERSLGVDHWAQAECSIRSVQFRAGPPAGIAFEGRFDEGPRGIDFRLLLPRLLEDFAARGGRVVIEPSPDVAGLERLAAGHDLMVVAVGRRSMADLFPVDRSRSPYTQPQRLLFVGLFEGFAIPDPPALSYNLSPGAGEVFQMPMWTADGLATNVFVEAVPGGPLAPLAELSFEDPGFVPLLTKLLREHAPAMANRIDPRRFALRGPKDALQGAVTPAVRQAWAMPGGRLAIAIGDAWITNDPLTAQGANLASHSAWVAAEHIVKGGPFDRAFGERLEREMWEYASSVTAFTNAFLQPPPPHVFELMAAAATHQAVADRFAPLFGDPPRMLQTMASPATVAAFIEDALRLDPKAGSPAVEK